MFCYQTVIINILQTKYRCGYFLYIRHYFPDFIIILYTTKPQKPKSLGLYSHQYSVIRYDYSMMEATVPDPTVRPPSRYQTGILECLNGVFQFILSYKLPFFRRFHLVFKFFVIILLSKILFPLY